jgi:hypothetical protein
MLWIFGLSIPLYQANSKETGFGSAAILILISIK